MAVLDGPALRGLRHPLPRACTEPVLVQFAARRLRDLPRLRSRHRHRLWARDPGQRQVAAGRGSATLADRVQPRVPGRPAQVRAQARHPRRRAMARTHGRATALGHRWRRAVGQEDVVWRAPLFQVARGQELQDARARAALEVPQLYAMPRVRWRETQARGPVVASRRTGRWQARAQHPRAAAAAHRSMP